MDQQHDSIRGIAHAPGGGSHPDCDGRTHACDECERSVCECSAWQHYDCSGE
jgi:hypothetical protein